MTDTLQLYMPSIKVDDIHKKRQLGYEQILGPMKKSNFKNIDILNPFAFQKSNFMQRTISSDAILRPALHPNIDNLFGIKPAAPATMPEKKRQSNYTNEQVTALAGVVKTIADKIKQAQGDLSKLQSDYETDSAVDNSLKAAVTDKYCGYVFKKAATSAVNGYRYFFVGKINAPMPADTNVTACDTNMYNYMVFQQNLGQYQNNITQKKADIVHLNADLQTAQKNYDNALKSLTPEQQAEVNKNAADAEKASIKNQVIKYASYTGITLGAIGLFLAGRWAYRKYLKTPKAAAA